MVGMEEMDAALKNLLVGKAKATVKAPSSDWCGTYNWGAQFGDGDDCCTDVKCNGGNSCCTVVVSFWPTLSFAFQVLHNQSRWEFCPDLTGAKGEHLNIPPSDWNIEECLDGMGGGRRDQLGPRRSHSQECNSEIAQQPVLFAHCPATSFIFRRPGMRHRMATSMSKENS